MASEKEKQEKVNSLISLAEKLSELSIDLKFKDLSKSLTTACSMLKTKNLSGIEFIAELSRQASKFETDHSEFHVQIEQLNSLAIEVQTMFDQDEIPLTRAEELFLNLAYDKFTDIATEIYTPDFWSKSAQYRFSKISQLFSVYGEALNHEPFEGILKWQSKYRPPLEAEISGPLFKFIRNILAHFPFFDTWDEIWISQELVNWKKPNQSIDKFLTKFSGSPGTKYRFKEKSKPDFTYVEIHFPREYGNEKIYLKDMIREEEGVKFAVVMMLRVLETQIKSIEE